MGILNATPDSFWEGSRVSGAEAAARTALAMLRAGASILDIGGESTRPGSAYLSAEEEIARVEPAIRAVRAAAAAEGLDPVLSVDTRKAAVARAALEAGADLVNDVSALEDDPDLAGLCAERGVPVILMHKKGVPATMQNAPWYEDCAGEVRDYLLAAADRARAAGIPGDRILLDPGIGFGKRLEDNLDLLGRLAELRAHGYPVVVGLSRKSFLGALTGRAVEERLAGSIAAACAAFLGGADVFRVHDVPETVDALKVFGAILGRTAAEGKGTP
ncbi:MAG TPA: dihydropteroate synthase [Spirochaetia bacterium]|nr:dihydropteroate synthase [Spirochaetia bacterium]